MLGLYQVFRKQDWEKKEKKIDPANYFILAFAAGAFLLAIAI
jgi:hypothetical protein